MMRVLGMKMAKKWRLHLAREAWAGGMWVISLDEGLVGILTDLPGKQAGKGVKGIVSGEERYI